MMAKAFGTKSIPESKQQEQPENKTTTRTTKTRSKDKAAVSTTNVVTNTNNTLSSSSSSRNIAVESLDTDSVMTFLSHLGVKQYEVHKRISDTLLKQLDDEIRKTKNEESLLDLLRESWSYAVSLPELRPIIWSVLRQLGEKTPQAVLQALAERQDDDDDDGGDDNNKNGSSSSSSLKHADIFRPLPALLKKLVWEGDWIARFPTESSSSSDQVPKAFFRDCEKTLLYETIYPLVTQYCTNTTLCESANRPFVASNRERRLLTTQRRALNSSSSSSSSMDKSITATTTTTTTAAGLLGNSGGGGGGGGKSSSNTKDKTQDNVSSSKAISQLRVFLSDSGGGTTALSFRPKLLYALMTMLIARHGMQEHCILGGATHLHCTLVSDVLLSSGGPLPKAYHHVQNLVRIVDECVQDGNISNDAITNIQTALREIFLTDHDGSVVVDTATVVTTTTTNNNKKDKEGAQGTGTASAATTAATTAADKNNKSEEVNMTNALQRQLNHIITAGITALKESDPQSLFLNPVTDQIAPGYSKIIKKPICILDMEEKIDMNEYKSTDEWKHQVQLMFKNCHDYNKGKAGQWFRGEALRQKKIFEEEIYPQARRLYQTEIVKRQTEEEEDRKRKAMAKKPAISPLEKATKKRKKDREEFIPSMPSLAFMILTDPFFVRIVVARILREARVCITGGMTIPAASFVVPSLLQLLHMARWSSQICAIRGKRYFVPSGGLIPFKESSSASSSLLDRDDPAMFVPYATLRQDLPLLLRLILESELDKRVVSGGDLHDAAESETSLAPSPILPQEWIHGPYLEVPLVLMEGALVHLCQPGTTTNASLAVTFPKFATAISHLSPTFVQDRLFFQCLIRAIIRHKAKLSKVTRDAIVNAWIVWLSNHDGSMVSAAHECFIQLLNDWSGIGNQILPRDTLLSFVANAIKAVEFSSSHKQSTDESQHHQASFAEVWKSIITTDNDKEEDVETLTTEGGEFGELLTLVRVKKQYLRMLKHLPTSSATLWKEQMGLVVMEEEDDDKTNNNNNKKKKDDDNKETVGDNNRNATMEENQNDGSGYTGGLK